MIRRLALAALLLIPLLGSAPQTWVNIKDSAIPGGPAVGNGSTDDTAAIQAAMDYASAHGLSGVYCPQGLYKTTSPLYLDPPGNLRSNLSNPTMFQFSLSFFGDPSGGGPLPACQIKPTFNNNVALYVGPGQGMRVSDIAVIGPATQYRGNQSTSGVGIGLTGGNGGSSINLVENTYVANFHSLYQTDANGACCLNDSNTFRKVSGDNGYIGIDIEGTQSYINDVVEPRLVATIDVYSPVGKAVNIYGGNLSAGSAQQSSFSISGATPPSCAGGTTGSVFCLTSGGQYQVNVTIASPDQYIPNVYNAYMMVTAHFGIVPFTLTSWNSGSSVATLQLLPSWATGNYGQANLLTTNALQADIAAVTTLYATEKVTVALGAGNILDGVHVENPSACQTFLDTSTGFNGQSFTEARGPYFNSDPSAPATTARQLCQLSFPFIVSKAGPPLRLIGGSYNASFAPLIIDADVDPGDVLHGEALNTFRDQYRTLTGNFAYINSQTYGQQPSEQLGFGTWDTDYSTPMAVSGAAGFTQWLDGFMAGSYCGYYPCQDREPNLPPSVYSEVSGALGALGTYPPISCQTVYKSVEWNSGALTNLHLRSASCPGFSWGQNLTNALVGGTVTWSYSGQSDVLYLDANSIKWMFPGLGISIDNGGGPVSYIVTGVYPAVSGASSAAYITVLNPNASFGFLAGTSGTIYSCSSSCTIGQAAFSWTAYP